MDEQVYFKYKNGYKIKAISELLGMARMLSIGPINTEQVKALHGWLDRQEHFAHIFPFSEVVPVVKKVLADGVVDEEEKVELINLFGSLVGSLQGEDETFATTPSLLPFSEPVLEFESSGFVLTGVFLMSKRSAVEEIIKRKGGTCQRNISGNTRYIVIGGVASDAYKYGNFGTKIEDALELKKKGAKIEFISEEWLVRFI
ncbi:BRCT domain-containing protein [Helicobacter sp. 11S02629-2]|uniref:BRCT domain-containing protein n=1 Tax=Helicobacter sp. 11S02629-2 TaxID=1476195 RepID=UPI000BA650B3|nr:BRCT domain-containing protein [Helicobacter sp. 11S02629-2]PAF44156.1 hypothetical protein BKH40_06050 [Helicobacter sp. 11S02629-2]